MKPRLLGAAVALLVFLVDQGSKLWLLREFNIAEKQPVRLAPVLDIVLAWNRGISYSLFTTDSARGPYVLLAITLAVTMLLILWLWRARTMPTVAALGLLIGGALGNAYDRFAYGAVVDFIYFHVGGFSWYIFNMADAAITIGVALLIFESIGGSPAPSASKLPENQRT